MLVELLPPVAIRLIYAVLIAINVIAFAVYGLDKKRAIHSSACTRSGTRPASRSSPTACPSCWPCTWHSSIGYSYKNQNYEKTIRPGRLF